MRRRAAQQKLRFISWKTKKNRDKTLKNELAAWTMAYKWLENAVAPLAGAWIEIRSPRSINKDFEQSHPSRVRGLKSLSVAL